MEIKIRDRRLYAEFNGQMYRIERDGRAAKENRAMEEKWVLNHGCWRGTIASRDQAMPEKFDTREDAITKLNEHRKWYRGIGYEIWYAELTAPDGTKTTLA